MASARKPMAEHVDDNSRQENAHQEGGDAIAFRMKEILQKTMDAVKVHVASEKERLSRWLRSSTLGPDNLSDAIVIEQNWLAAWR